MKKMIALFLSAAVTLSLAACSGSTENSSGDDSIETTADETFVKQETSANVSEDSYTIGFAVNALDEVQSILVNAFTVYAEGKGAKVVVLNADSNVDKQITDIESLITQGVDAIVIQAVDSDAVCDVAQQAMDADIPVIDSIFGINTPCTLHVSYDFYTYASHQGQYIRDYLEENPEEQLKIGYCWGAQGTNLTDKLYNGFTETLFADNTYADRVEILVEKVVDWDANKTISTVEDWLQAYPQMNCIVTMSDTMTMAAVQALQAAGEDITAWITVGKDGSEDALESISNGEMTATIYAPLDTYAQELARQVLNILDGTSNPKLGEEYGVSEFVTISKDNASDYIQ